MIIFGLNEVKMQNCELRCLKISIQVLSGQMFNTQATIARYQVSGNVTWNLKDNMDLLNVCK